MKKNEVLKHYEMPYNSGLTDNIVKRIAAQAIDMTDRAIVQECIKVASKAGVTDLYLMDEKFLSEAIAEKLDRMKTEPLTLEELRQMDGEPVYVLDLGIGKDSQWCILSVGDYYSAAMVGGSECVSFHFDDYGETWLAFRHKVKEGS